MLSLQQWCQVDFTISPMAAPNPSHIMDLMSPYVTGNSVHWSHLQATDEVYTDNFAYLQSRSVPLVLISLPAPDSCARSHLSLLIWKSISTSWFGELPSSKSPNWTEISSALDKLVSGTIQMASGTLTYVNIVRCVKIQERAKFVNLIGVLIRYGLLEHGSTTIRFCTESPWARSVTG